MIPYNNGPDLNKLFLRGFFKCVIIALFIAIILFVLGGCKVVKSLKQSSRDSSVVHSDKQGASRSDSSGTKSDKTNTKETVYYPQPIYIQGKDGETKVVFVPEKVKETGTEKTEQAQVIKDTSWKDAFNSLILAINNKQTETKTRVGPSIIEWILIAGLGLIFIKQFAPTITKLLTKI